MNPLISIIVPIYNVELYIDECIHSLQNQSYQNLEIILVDDGSPDKCPQMCEEYARRDARIKVIHKHNGGLSDARNAGIEIATGEFIGFVDSDDCIMPYMYETLLNKIEEYNADIISCKFANYIEGKITQSGIKTLCGYEEGKVLTLKEYFTEVVYEHLDNASWNKLYRRCILSERFRKGRNNEDFLFFSQLAMNNPDAKIAFTTETFYKYRQQRVGSICADPIGLWIANYANRKEIISNIDSWCPELHHVLQNQNDELLFGIIYEMCADSVKLQKHQSAFEALHKEFLKLPDRKITANKLDIAILKHRPSIYSKFIKYRSLLKGK